MNTDPKSEENKEKTNSSSKENNSECKELKIDKKDNEKVAPIVSKVQFITTTDFHKENKEKKRKKITKLIII